MSSRKLDSTLWPSVLTRIGCGEEAKFGCCTGGPARFAPKGRDALSTWGRIQPPSEGQGVPLLDPLGGPPPPAVLTCTELVMVLRAKTVAQSLMVDWLSKAPWVSMSSTATWAGTPRKLSWVSLRVHPHMLPTGTPNAGGGEAVCVWGGGPLPSSRPAC